MKRSSLHFIKAALLLSFLFVLAYCGRLASSDFPRCVWGPPPQSQSSHYDDVQDLGANRIWNTASTYTNLSDYLDILENHGMKAILKKNQGNGYLLQYYSCAQHMIYEAEKIYNQATIDDWNRDGLAYYFFLPSLGAEDPNMPSTPPEAASWHFTYSPGSAGYVLEGPRYTGISTQSYLEQEWKPRWPNKDSTYTVYKHRISAAADIDGLPDDSLVFRLVMQYKYRDSSDDLFIIQADSIQIHAGDFAASQSFQDFALPPATDVGDTIFNEYPSQAGSRFVAVNYKIWWARKCDLWIDHIESMDMWRGYPFYWTAAGHHNILAAICDTAAAVQAACGYVLEAFMQSDVTRRMAYGPHEVVKDYLLEQARIHRLPQKKALDIAANIH